MKLGAIVCLVAILAQVGAVVPAAGARDPDRHRKVAVLEYRAGAAGAPELGLRLAIILRNTTSLEIVDPDDARRQLGANIDETLARCAGEARCVGAIGGKLGADEVLLVGVSELGDLIVALQRVNVKSRQVSARIAESLAPDAEPDDGTLEGYLRKLMPRSDFLRYGTIRVTANVAGALVIIGDQSRGKTPLPPVTVEAPADYDIRVTKKGYSDFTARVQVPPDAMVEVRPELLRRGGRAGWYDHWWVWAIAGTVVTGAVIGGVALSQDDPTSSDATLIWPF